jgi:ribose-phosphate pyrophosphokinase
MSSVLSPEQKDSIYIAGGFVHPELTDGIAHSMGVAVGEVEQKLQPNGEVYSRFGSSVRGKHVFIVEPHLSDNGVTVNDAIMQQCMLADAARSSSATDITAVSPYLAYTRQDRKTRGREPIGIRVLINQLATAGVTRIVTVDMHSPHTKVLPKGFEKNLRKVDKIEYINSIPTEWKRKKK